MFTKNKNDYQLYGLWNCLKAYDSYNELVDIIPAHDGDFFPENPKDYVDALRESLQIQRRKIHSWPIRVDIDITQRCTSNCCFCYSRKYAGNKIYKNAEISLDQFKKIVHELSINGTKTIRLTGGGEPLYHPQIKEIIGVLNQDNLKSCIITNGELLDFDISKIIVENIDHLRISINASKNQTRSKLHHPRSGTNKLSGIFSQISYINKLRRKINTEYKKPLIWTTFLILPENIVEMFEAAQIVRDCGADSISFRPVYHDLSNCYTKPSMDLLRKNIKRIKELHSPPNFFTFTPKRDIFSVWKINPKSQFKKCISCNMRTIIEATNLGPMINICGLYRGNLNSNLGIIKNKLNFSDFWNSDNTKTSLDKMIYKCNNCIDISMNITLNKIHKILKDNNKARFNKDWLPG